MTLTSAPLIGVVADHKPIGLRQRPFAGSYTDYLDCVTEAGGLPVLIPLGLPADVLRGIFERVDGVLLTGGGDVDPAFLGIEPHPAIGNVNPLRDSTEIQITRWAADADVPLFGICRGHQVANVALGGTLIVDIPSQVPTDLAHDFSDDTPLDIYAHPVSITPGSQLAQIVGAENLTVNSWHHQSVDKPGADLIVTACTADGVVEATERPGGGFLLTVQWHPEKLFGKDVAARALFAAFVTAARDSQNGK